MSKDDGSYAKIFRELRMGERLCETMTSMKFLTGYVQTMRDEEHISDILMSVCFNAMVSVLAATKDPAEYEKFCEDMGRYLYKAVVEEKRLLDAREKP
jgi:hypothetical protein